MICELRKVEMGLQIFWMNVDMRQNGCFTRRRQVRMGTEKPVHIRQQFLRNMLI